MRDRRDYREVPQDQLDTPQRTDRARIALALIGLAGALGVLALNIQM